VDILRGAVSGGNKIAFPLSFLILGAYCLGLFLRSIGTIRQKWII